MLRRNVVFEGQGWYCKCVHIFICLYIPCIYNWVIVTTRYGWWIAQKHCKSVGKGGRHHHHYHPDQINRRLVLRWMPQGHLQPAMRYINVASTSILTYRNDTYHIHTCPYFLPLQIVSQAHQDSARAWSLSFSTLYVNLVGIITCLVTTGHSEAARTLCLVCKDGLQDPQATEGTVYAKTEILPLAPVTRPLRETVSIISCFNVSTLVSVCCSSLCHEDLYSWLKMIQSYCRSRMVQVSSSISILCCFDWSDGYMGTVEA